MRSPSRPPEPGINRPGFIDHDDGANIRTGPAELGGTPLTAEPLPTTTRVFVSGKHKEAPEWWYVSAFLPSAIVRGYVQCFRINTDLPEPSAKLHQIKSGDTVERLAVEEFAAAVRDGHDLRYYENVLLAVNRDKHRAGIKGTLSRIPTCFGGGANNIQLEAGRRIWLVSPAYAKALEGLVPSGSLTGGAYAKAGRVLGHLRRIPAELLDLDAVDRTRITEDDFAPLRELALRMTQHGQRVSVMLTDFVMPPEAIPRGAKAQAGAVSHWSQWIDYWAVDWQHREGTFCNAWRAFRRPGNPELPLQIEHEYPQAGTYLVAVKVIALLEQETVRVHPINLRASGLRSLSDADREEA